MTPASYIFWAIFVLPLIAFLVWIMRQDKRKGKLGLIVLAVIVVGVIIFIDTAGFNRAHQFIGIVDAHVDYFRILLFF